MPPLLLLLLFLLPPLLLTRPLLPRLSEKLPEPAIRWKYLASISCITFPLYRYG
nr:MAG TPA: hypothetical protein [Caudoviricetes sp.]